MGWHHWRPDLRAAAHYHENTVGSAGVWSAAGHPHRTGQGPPESNTDEEVPMEKLTSGAGLHGQASTPETAKLVQSDGRHRHEKPRSDTWNCGPATNS